MTRRDRMIHILDSFGRLADWERESVIARLGHAAFTDEAIDMMARETVKSHRHQQRAHKRSREIAAQQRAIEMAPQAAE